MASSEFSPHDILSRRLVRWGVSEEAADKLTRENSEVVQILQLNCLELMRQTNRNPDFNEIIIDKIAGKCAPTLRTLKDLITEKEFLPSVPTSLLPLDRLLEGGIPRGSVTEFVGPPGAGKTQFCLLMALMASIEGDPLWSEMSQFNLKIGKISPSHLLLVGLLA
jgi:RAD51-like protein 1